MDKITLHKAMFTAAMTAYYKAQNRSPFGGAWIDHQVELWIQGWRHADVHSDTFKVADLLTRMCEP